MRRRVHTHVLFGCLVLVAAASCVAATPLRDTRRTRYAFGEVELDIMCGPKSLLAVAGLFAMEATLDAFTEMTQPDENGTTMFALHEAAKRFGLSVSAHRLGSVDALEKRDQIAIAWVNQNHFFVVERIVGDYVRVLNHQVDTPILIGRQEFADMWTGECLLFERSRRPRRAPRIELERYIQDFGIAPASSTIRTKFVFRNTGNAPLKVLGNVPSCGCMSSLASKDVIEPGKEGILDVHTEIKPEERGQLDLSVGIRTNDPVTPLALVTMTSRVTGGISIKPRKLYLDRVTTGSRINRTVIFGHHSDYPFEVVSVDSSSGRVQYEGLERSEDETRLRFQIAADAPTPEFEEEITVFVHGVNDPPLEVSEYKIPVEGVVIDEVEVYPTRFFFGIVSPAKSPVSAVQLTNNAGGEFVVTEAVSSSPDVAVEIRPAGFEGAYIVRALLLPTAKPGRMEETITIHTSNERYATVEVPLFGVVK